MASFSVRHEFTDPRTYSVINLFLTRRYMHKLNKLCKNRMVHTQSPLENLMIVSLHDPDQILVWKFLTALR